MSREKIIRFRNRITDQLRFEINSPMIIANQINIIIVHLDKYRSRDEHLEVDLVKSMLRKAKENADEFSKDLRYDLDGEYSNAKHENPQFWYQEVIGLAESALDIFLRGKGSGDYSVFE